MSVLKPEGSLMAGLAVGALVYGVYSFSLPNTATMHATEANDRNIEAGRKKAAWTSASVVAAVSLMTKDTTIFTLGGIVLIALDWHARHANAVTPDTGTLVANTGYEPATAAGVEPPIPGQAAF